MRAHVRPAVNPADPVFIGGVTRENGIALRGGGGGGCRNTFRAA